jgi:tetratricopeptide (TPR) repeat protein
MFGLLFGGIAARSAGSATERGPHFSGKLVLLAQATLVAGLMVMSWARCHDWRNDETLFSASSRARPKSPRAHFIVGKMAADRRDDAEALQRYETAIALYPDYAAAWAEKGVTLGHGGDYVLAERAFREALRINPRYSDAHLNLGIALRRQARPGEAERSLRRAALWDPRSSKTWAELGNLYLEHRRYCPAAEAYRRAIALGRSDLEPRLREAESRAVTSR